MDLYRNIQRHYPKPEPYATEVVRHDQWKLLTLDGNPVELFDILADPTEQHNLLSQQPAIVANLTTQLHAWLAAPRTPVNHGS